MKTMGIGLLVEEQRGDVAAAWKRAVEEELGGEAALAFAVGPLLREMGLALRSESPSRSAPRRTDEGALRSAVLVRSGASPARVAREFKLLHRALWTSLRAAGRIVGAEDRRAADEWLHEALAAALDRLDRVRMRIDLLERAPAPIPALPRASVSGQRPPPLPAARRTATPPPVPVAASPLIE
jgi:hypothetical protein